VRAADVTGFSRDQLEMPEHRTAAAQAAQRSARVGRASDTQEQTRARVDTFAELWHVVAERKLGPERRETLTNQWGGVPATVRNVPQGPGTPVREEVRVRYDVLARFYRAFLLPLGFKNLYDFIQHAGGAGTWYVFMQSLSLAARGWLAAASSTSEQRLLEAGSAASPEAMGSRCTSGAVSAGGQPSDVSPDASSLSLSDRIVQLLRQRERWRLSSADAGRRTFSRRLHWARQLLALILEFIGEALGISGGHATVMRVSLAPSCLPSSVGVSIAAGPAGG